VTTFLLTALILLDVGLLAAVIFLNRRQEAQVELVAELTEERRLLAELRTSVQEELEAAQSRSREMLDKVTMMATEAEMEVKSGGETLARELESVADQLTTRFETPLKDLARKQSHVESLLKRVESEKTLLQKLVQRGEKLAKFFDERIPYEDVLSEIADKKYVDARSLLARGVTPAQIAHELGMSESEVRVLAGLSLR
jgi:hypothetical protein